MIPRSAVDDVDANGDTALSWAVRRRDSGSVKQLLLCGSDPGHVDSSSRQTPLHLAVWLGDVAVVQLLLAAKVDVNSKDIWGATPLSLAACNHEDNKIMELILAHGASIECQNNDGFRPLHYAAYYNRPASLRILLDRSANINAATKSGMTALMLGMTYNAHEALRILLRDEALDFNVKDSVGDSVLDHAALWGDLETLDLLQASCHIKGLDLDGSKALGYAMWRRDDNQAWSLWMIKPPDNDPHLWYSTFEVLWYSILGAQRRDLEGDPEPGEGFVEEELTDDAEDELTDDAEDSDSHVWEDAQEDLDESLA